MSAPVFLLATDLRPELAAWELIRAQAASLQQSLARPLGLDPIVDLVSLPTQFGVPSPDWLLNHVIDRYATTGTTECFVLPVALEFNIWQRSLLGEELTEARRRHPRLSLHHDSVDPTYPLLLDCFTQLAHQGLHEMGVTPQQAGLLLVANGQGDPGTRADSYRLMRLLWEQSGVSRAEVGFVRYPLPFLRDSLQHCLNDSLQWVLVPQAQWEGEVCEYARVLLADHQRSHLDAANWLMVTPPGDHPAITGWLEQRIRRLWQDKRARQAVRIPSVKNQSAPPQSEIWSGQQWQDLNPIDTPPSAGYIARARSPEPLAEFLARVLPRADRYLIKVTWHGYATGTYTGPAALDMLLRALPGQAVILEGHTSGRNLGGLDIDWENGAEPHRAWIRQQELEYLRRTGLAQVIANHGAQYLNVSEAWWDGDCAHADVVLDALGDIELTRPELAGFVPSVLLQLRGAPFISFARFKGPTRLGISNFFGLIPHPLRTQWHGTGVIDFATVCCDLVRLYGALFPLYGLVEAFDSAVRWDRKGLYRSRWGNYDLVLTDGLFTFSEGLVGADLLASRLQGQDVQRSAFYDVVRNHLGWSDSAENLALPTELQIALA